MSVLTSGLTRESDQIVLCPEDFPLNFEEGKHPEDYEVRDKPIRPEFIYHHIRGKFNRLWLRISWEICPGQYMSLSFLLDTGAPKHLYLNSDTLSKLEAAGLMKVDEDLNIQYTKLFGRNCHVDETPFPHKPANLMGLKLLKRLGLTLHEDEPHFSFTKPFTYLTAEPFTNLTAVVPNDG